MGNCSQNLALNRSSSQIPKSGQPLNKSSSNSFDSEGIASEKLRRHIFANINENQYEYKKFQQTKKSFNCKINYREGTIMLSFMVTQDDANSNTDKSSQQQLYQVDLASIDNFKTENRANITITETTKIKKEKTSTKSACLKQIISQNRLRYTSEEFNLDLAYITKRVIAMGFPAEGMRQIYRNSLDQVLDFFKKTHKNKVKVYNMCDDNFINLNKLSFNDGDVQVAYFPMMDHNPGPIKLLFYCILDQILFLAQNPDNMIAVHCKAGKGRTGVQICTYLIFMEACTDTYDAVEFFNNRRTKDGKGLTVPSQKRYLHYFDRFIKSTFQRPYKQLIVPFVKDPKCFEQFFEPKNRLKLMSVCLGPFKTYPQLIVKLYLKSFEKDSLLSKIKSKQKPYIQQVVYNQTQKSYYIIIIMQEEVVISDDIDIRIRSNNSKPTLKFHYWLNARFILEGVGKTYINSFEDTDQLGLQHFMTHDSTSFKNQQFDSFKIEGNLQNLNSHIKQNNASATMVSSSASSGIQSSMQSDQSTPGADDNLGQLSDLLRSNINRYEQNGLKKASAKKNSTKSNTFIQNETTKKSFVYQQQKTYSEEAKQESKILSFQNFKNATSQDIFSESEDNQCIVKDDNEEDRPLVANDSGSFQGGASNIAHYRKNIIQQSHDSPSFRASGKKKVPSFPGQQSKSEHIIHESLLEDGCLSQSDDEASIMGQSIHSSDISAKDGIQGQYVGLKQFSKQTITNVNGRFNANKDHKKNRLSRGEQSIASYQQINNNNNQSGALQNSNFPFQSQSCSSLNKNQVTANFEDINKSESQLMNFSELEYVQNGEGKQPDYSASNESENDSNIENLEQNLIPAGKTKLQSQIRQDYKNVAKNKISLGVSDRINELKDSRDNNQLMNSVQSNSIAPYINNNSSVIKNKLANKAENMTNNSRQTNFIGVQNSNMKSKDMKKLVQVNLCALELDKFKELKQLPDFRAFTTFYCNPKLDSILLSKKK